MNYQSLYKIIYDDILYSAVPVEFDPIEYAAANTDLNHLNEDQLKKHYLLYGFKEGRPVYTSYGLWRKQHAIQKPNIEEFTQSLSKAPKFSILVPVYNTNIDFLKSCLDSVLEQFYPYWELCIADDFSSDTEIKNILESYKNKDDRIKIIYRKQTGHISEATNSALSLASGEFVCLLDSDDLLSPDALYEIAKLLKNQPEIDMIYSDEDRLSEDGRFIEPFFKPDWSPDTFLSVMYTCHLSTYRRSIINDIGGFRVGYEGSQDWDLALRFTEKTNKIAHIPKILYHWRIHSNSTASGLPVKLYANTSSKKAIEEALLRRNEPGNVITCQDKTKYTVRYKIKDYSKKVSIILLTKDKPELLSDCLQSIFSLTSYPNYEIILVDNGSKLSTTKKLINEWKQKESQRLKVLHLDIPFNYAVINNYAIYKSNGEYILLLNDDTKIIDNDWLDAMIEYAQRPSIGAVGPLLLDSDNKIQHAGVIAGSGGVAGNAYIGKQLENTDGYFYNLHYPRNVAAVTGSCLMCRREVFNEIGGMCEELAVSFNDTDLCFKILDCGYMNIFLPHVKLYHYESQTRGNEDTSEKKERFIEEVSIMRDRWMKYISNDPFYSPHLQDSDYTIKC